MSDHITAYPLQWPPGWESQRRESGVFKTELPAALSNLRKEVERLGAADALICRPRSQARMSRNLARILTALSGIPLIPDS